MINLWKGDTVYKVERDHQGIPQKVVQYVYIGVHAQMSHLSEFKDSEGNYESAYNHHDSQDWFLNRDDAVKWAQEILASRLKFHVESVAEMQRLQTEIV